MALYAIGDLHLSLDSPKPMDIFGEQWRDHHLRIADDWDSLVSSEDTVLIAGDISWALKIEQAMADIEWISARPGHKILIRGNHDYWWRREATNRIQRSIPSDITLLVGHCITIGSTAIAGTRGWRLEEGTVADEKVLKREQMYLERALNEIPDGYRRIVLLHYPPFDQDMTPNSFDILARQYNADEIIYGHIHGGDTIDGEVDGVIYRCVSADHIDFKPALIME